ncbi:MFS transporter [Litorimonas haliclonae]|uniref:MFS transporter n=1 Tax=Litorimonas haliclonae TaxID=2081977 RepID=UPI0039EF600A
MTEISQSATAPSAWHNWVREWAVGWPIVLASFVGIGLCLSPLPYYATITISPELGKVFGWDRVTTTSAFIFMTAGVLVGAPLAGSLTDKYGARRVLIPAIIMLGLGTAALGLTNENPLVFYTIFYLAAVFGSGTLPLTWSKAIVNNFDKSRGLALGLALTGTGVFGFLAPPFIRSVIDVMDWRMAYFVVGSLPLLLSLPLAFWLFRDKKEEAAIAARETSNKNSKNWIVPIIMIIGVWALIAGSLEAVGVVWAAVLMTVFLLGFIAFETIREKPGDASPLPGLTLKQTVRDYRFWVILVSFLLLGACVSGIIINVINILLDKGYSPQLASSGFAGLGLIGFSVVVGRLLGGLVVDYVWAPLVAFIFMGVPAIGCWILMQDMSQGYNSLAIILVGVAAGVEFDLMAFLVSRYLGMKAYGRIYSFVYAAFGIGSGTAGAIFNAIKGDAPNYNSVLTYSMIGFILGATILLTLGRYRNFEEEVPLP